MIATILDTKLHVPTLRGQILIRNHLFQQLDVLLEPGMRLGLIAAPAGFGKTTLIVQWLSHQRQWRAGWLSLDREHSEPMRFLTYVVRIFEKVYPNSLFDIRALIESGNATPEIVLSQLLNWLAKTNEHMLIVLDDYHEIHDQRVHDTLSLFIEYMPENVRLILTSRVDPALLLGRMRARQQLVEIRAEQLRLTDNETHEFLETVMNLHVSTDIVSVLKTRTEGWLAALQLVALSLKNINGSKQREDFVYAFAGSHRHIVDYLAEEVLYRQSPDVLKFLLQTSILDRFCPDLCESVTRHAGGRAMLDYLDRANLFLIPLDNANEWYRYHHLFADLLRVHLKRDQPHIIHELHQRAADWFEANNLVTEAMQHSLAGEDFEKAAKIFMKNSLTMISRGEIEMAHQWLSALPVPIIMTHSPLCLDRARLLLLQHKISGVDELLNTAEQQLGARQTLNTDEHILLGNAIALRAYVAHERYKFEEAITHLNRAMTFFPPERMGDKGACLLLLAHSYHFGGWTRNAVSYFLEAIVMLQKAQNAFSSMMGMGQLATVYELLGNLHQAKAILEDAFNWAGLHGVQDLTPAAVPHVRLANILREWNMLDEAEEHLRTAIKLAKGGRPLVVMRAHVFLARVLMAREDWSGAESEMIQAQHIVKDWETDIERSFVDFNHVILFLRRGDLHRVESWLQREKLTMPDVSQVLPNYTEQKLLVWARYLIAVGRIENDAATILNSLELLGRLHQIGTNAERIGIVIEICVLQALAHDILQHNTQAMKALSEALDYAAPQGYTRIFLDEGKPLLDMLRRISHDHPNADYVKHILQSEALYGEFQLSSNKKLYETADGMLLETLSERELQVLYLLSQGLSSNEIADQLIIAVETARKHIKNIYSKLDVHNKVEAIRRAQELRLL